MGEKDREGNGIFHYAVLYGGKDTQTIERLIETSVKLSTNIDEKNQLGFTPLLFAAFCGRYDLVLTILTKTTASPFIRDGLLHKNVFDYVEDDLRPKPFVHYNPELRVRLHSTIPPPGVVQRLTSKNFFQEISLRSQPETIRRLILERLHTEHSSADFLHLRNYLNQRYKHLQSSTIIPPIDGRMNSKTYIHHLLNLYDPNPRPRMLSPAKQPMTFKKLSTKVTTINAFARASLKNKRAGSRE